MLLSGQGFIWLARDRRRRPAADRLHIFTRVLLTSTFYPGNIGANLNAEGNMTNKRLLKQQYLAAPTRAGVYAIRNGVTGRVLLAASTDANGALNRHRFELRRGAHRNRLLNQEWARDGEANFSFAVLDTVKRRDDPAFDLAAELKDLLELWRQELAGEGAQGAAFYEAAA
jgi:hypothetical protein